MPPAGNDDVLATGYLFRLHKAEHLRYRTDRWPATPQADWEFQAGIVARARQTKPTAACSSCWESVAPVKIPASTELAAASATRRRSERGQSVQLTSAALAGILDACGGDPFTAVGSLIESGHAIPAETRGALASALALAGMSEARAAAVLFLLDPDSNVRRSAAAALAQVAASLGPTEVRRLIAMRNWRPENERAGVDAIIRKARAVGIGCAQWTAGSVETILASCIDGASAQGFPLVSPAGRKKRLSSILMRRPDRRCLERRAGSASRD
jgi:hypothetical protein